MEKFAIGIPTYQRADGKSPFFLKRALDSVFSQTYENFLVYVVGDRYDDNDELFNIIRSYPDRIYCENLSHAIEREKYGSDKTKIWSVAGVNAANTYVDLALNGGYDYICHLDHDDWWFSNHLEVLNAFIDKTKADWVCTRAKSIYHNKFFPPVSTVKEYVEYLPTPSAVIHSSTCMNFNTIPLRYVDTYACDRKIKAADAEMWVRCSDYIIEHKLKSYFVNSFTCMHETERR